MENADDVPAEELSGFEQRLAASVMKAVNQETAEVRLNHLSWESVSQCIWEKLRDL